MTYTRKHNVIPVFFWFILSVLYLELLFICIILVLLIIISLIKNGIINLQMDNFTDFINFISDEHFFILWVALPIFFGYSISLLRSAVTEISIDKEFKELTFVYHSAFSMFLKKKRMTISFDKLDYYVERSKWSSFNNILMPLFPTKAIVFYLNNHYILRFGCTMGWTNRQFREIESALNKIMPPCATGKSL